MSLIYVAREIFSGRMAYRTGRCQSKLHPPVRLQPRQPRRLQFVDEEGVLQALALVVMKPTQQDEPSRGSGDRVPLGRMTYRSTVWRD